MICHHLCCLRLCRNNLWRSFLFGFFFNIIFNNIIFDDFESSFCNVLWFIFYFSHWFRVLDFCLRMFMFLLFLCFSCDFSHAKVYFLKCRSNNEDGIVVFVIVADAALYTCCCCRWRRCWCWWGRSKPSTLLLLNRCGGSNPFVSKINSKTLLELTGIVTRNWKLFDANCMLSAKLMRCCHLLRHLLLLLRFYFMFLFFFLFFFYIFSCTIFGSCTPNFLNVFYAFWSFKRNCFFHWYKINNF